MRDHPNGAGLVGIYFDQRFNGIHRKDNTIVSSIFLISALLVGLDQ